MSADDVTNHMTHLLDFSFGHQAATMSPPTPPIAGASFSQGTLSPASRGIVIVGSVGSASPGSISIERGGLDVTLRLCEVFHSVCMFLLSQEYMDSVCLGCVRAKGEKFLLQKKDWIWRLGHVWSHGIFEENTTRYG
jgi:hypothetical protein